MAMTEYFDAESVADSTKSNKGKEVRLESDTESIKQSTSSNKGKEIRKESDTDTESIAKSTSALGLSNQKSNEGKDKGKPLVIAIIGAGRCAHRHYLPAIEFARGDFYLDAVYSRSKASATKLAASSKVYAPRAYWDEEPSRNLDVLLARDDIQAVVVLMHPSVQSSIIKKALEAGKHVLSEKPVAQSSKSQRELEQWYNTRQWATQPRIWNVSENLMYFDTAHYAFEQLFLLGGPITSFCLRFYGIQMPVASEGYELLTRFALRLIAILRYLLSAYQERVTNVTAFTSLLRQELPPQDTVHAIMKLNSGGSGTFTISLGSDFQNELEIAIYTAEGAVVVNPGRVVVKSKTMDHGDGEYKPEEKLLKGGSFVRRDVVAFAEAILKGYSTPSAKSDRGLGDLQIWETLLESAQRGESLYIA
ncbi:uncharacterized protein PAC_15421 [Phialocephala subalpina]|uniref:Gfo/Idh/MocA-like oxidoreductase N-terminal domain-containing protein n=1 Tax=Phialocephala subalpina TaxID=576137 RepID=A0A1L7XKE0_9HELO|nr:uncharacterized protein PAC_15421 [Phialocephala subalpina]